MPEVESQLGNPPHEWSPPPAGTEIFEINTLPVSTWRNGLGRTREIAVRRADAGPGICWRLSQAELDSDAEFSRFPGMERVFTLLTTGPVRLAVDGEDRSVPREAPQRFSGEAEVSVTLREGRPERALNLMVTRGLGRGEVQILRSSGQLVLPRNHLVAVVVIDGTLVLRDGRTVSALEAILPSPETRSGASACDGLVHQLESVWAEGGGSVIVAAVQVFPCSGAVIG